MAPTNPGMPLEVATGLPVAPAYMNAVGHPIGHPVGSGPLMSVNTPHPLAQDAALLRQISGGLPVDLAQTMLCKLPRDIGSEDDQNRHLNA